MRKRSKKQRPQQKMSAAKKRQRDETSRIARHIESVRHKREKRVAAMKERMNEFKKELGFTDSQIN